MRLAAASLALIFAAGVAAAQEERPLAIAVDTPHEAVYALALDRAVRPPGLEDAYGELRIARRASCASITETQSLSAVFVQRGVQTRVEQTVNTSESREGDLFSVIVRQRGLNGVWRERSMRAERGADGVRLFRDDAAMGVAPADTLFPVAFQNAVLTAAAADDPRFEARLFDGAAPDALFVAVDIGVARPYQGAHAGDPLRRPNAWPLRAAWYARDGAGAPLLESESVVDAEGVMREARLPLSPATLRATLRSLVFSPRPAC